MVSGMTAKALLMTLALDIVLSGLVLGTTTSGGEEVANRYFDSRNFYVGN